MLYPEVVVFSKSAQATYVFHLLNVFIIKIKLRSLKSNMRINEKGDWPYRDFGYLSLFSVPIDLATWIRRELLLFCNFQQDSRL